MSVSRYVFYRGKKKVVVEKFYIKIYMHIHKYYLKSVKQGKEKKI